MKKYHKGFTMIELLIVITILGILAIAVISAINPIEQINRGRDSGGRSDAEQLLGAVDRFYASLGYYPWATTPQDNQTQDWENTKNATFTDTGGNLVLNNLAATTGELKTPFINRIIQPNYNTLYVFNRGTQGDSSYVCFKPQSNSFAKEAFNRCTSGMPSDVPASANSQVCPGDQVNTLSCLP